MMETEKLNNIKIIRGIMKDIIPTLEKEADKQLDQEEFSYTQQRAMINQIFNMTSGKNYNVPSIMLRLTVIDSLYSTNAQYSYFSIEDMAKKIYGLGKTDKDAAEYFYDLVNIGQTDTKGVFSSTYGIRKNCKPGSQQMSLMSKYAYYVLLQNPKEYPLGFPIYDSLAIEMYPLVYEKIEGTSISKSSLNAKIETYISALNNVRAKLFYIEEGGVFDNYQQYDILDAYLWRMGKVNNGNYSLLLTKTEYEQFIKNLGINYIKEQYEEYLGEKFKNKKWKGKSLLKSDKPNRYDYNFNTLVQYQCAKLDINNIVKNIHNSECIKQLIDHWKAFYCPEEQIYIFNPEHDLCIANGDENFVPPRSAVGFAKENTDLSGHLKRPNKQRRQIIPWGWNHALKKRLINEGVDPVTLPSEEELQFIRAHSRREFALDVDSRLSLGDSRVIGPDYRIVATGIDEIDAFITANGSAVLKSPLSGSGKGIRFVREGLSESDEGWCRRTLDKQGSVIVERRFEIIKECAMLFECHHEGLDFIGYSLFESRNGAYCRNILASNEDIEDILGGYISLKTLTSVREGLIAILADTLVGHYEGFLGVDQMICQTASPVFIPVSEINLRMTMGLIARNQYDLAHIRQGN